MEDYASNCKYETTYEACKWHQACGTWEGTLFRYIQPLGAKYMLVWYPNHGHYVFIGK